MPLARLAVLVPLWASLWLSVVSSAAVSLLAVLLLSTSSLTVLLLALAVLLLAVSSALALASTLSGVPPLGGVLPTLGTRGAAALLAASVPAVLLATVVPLLAAVSTLWLVLLRSVPAPGHVLLAVLGGPLLAAHRLPVPLSPLLLSLA